MMEPFTLYRIQLFQRQISLFERQWQPRDVLGAALEENLFLKLRTRIYYTEGKAIKPPYVFFKLVRTGRVKATHFVNGVAVDVHHPDEPYVDIAINCETGICAVGRNSKFLSSQDAIVFQLRRMLYATASVRSVSAEVHIAAIKDPDELVDYIRRSSIISKFYFDVRRENALDADDFVPQIKKLAGLSGAGKARTALSEGAIDPTVAERLVRSSASTGDDAGAWLKLPQWRRTQKKTLSSSTVEFDSEPPESDRDKFSKAMDAAYERARHGTEK